MLLVRPVQASAHPIAPCRTVPRRACGGLRCPAANQWVYGGQCAILFCTYRAAAKAAFARVTLARMSEALAVQMKGNEVETTPRLRLSRRPGR